MRIKKLNKNIILFVGYVVFIVAGAFSLSVLRPVGGSVFRLITGRYSVDEAKNTIDAAVTDDLMYHNQMVDLNGLRENLMGTRVIHKDDITVVKAESGSLIEAVNKLDESEMISVARTIRELQNVAQSNGAEFLYCAAPKKEQYERAPSNINNYAQYNYEYFLSLLAEYHVPYVDFSKTLIESGMSVSDMFYDSDHHWNTRFGFAAANAICEELDRKYGFAYDGQYADIEQYDVIEYPEWFLGSRGKKVGTYFSWNGADNFELLIPKFHTDMTEEQPFKNQIRKGSFEETVLYMEHMKKDLYRKNAYVTYSGGDFRLQIMKNNLNQNGKKVLLLRDSFACVVSPFLALQTSELHICDVREDEHYVGEKLNIAEYIEVIKPDYVLCLYTGVGDTSDSRYDFF